MFRRATVSIGILVLVSHPLLADFTYQETSTITGGMMAGMLKVAAVFSKQLREPTVSTVSVKGDRMAHRSSMHASVIDLSSETITSIDLQRKTYSVMTFEEMKQLMEQMSQKMKKNDQAQMSFKVSANATGKTKQAAGFDAKEMIMTMEMEGTDEKSGQKGGMTVTTDMWIAQGIPGYQEVREFYRRMSEKMSWTPGGSMFMQNADVAKGMAEVYKEVAKLEGVPVEQTISMGVAGQPAADGTAQSPPPQQQPKQEIPSVGGALGGALGGRFGLGRKKTSSDTPQQTPGAGAGSSGAPGSLLEMTTVLSSFSSGSVDDSQFSVPAGFKKVDSEIKKMK